MSIKNKQKMSFLKLIVIVLVFALIIIPLKVKKEQLSNNAHFIEKSDADTTIYNKQYYLLQNSLIQYDSIVKIGGWDSIPFSKDSIKLGKVNFIITQLRKRLEIEGYLLKKEVMKSDSFDFDLKNGLEIFQKDNGLAITGELNKKTVATLNIPAEKRIDQIKINMDRWKEIPKKIEKEYLLVNIANFMLDVIKDDSILFSMKTIVGRASRKTPSFEGKITSIIFNPSWYIPESIQKKGIFPDIKNDPDYLKKKNMRIFQTDAKGHRKEISTDSINWSATSTHNFKYKIVQDPGLDNALGFIKFMFPNKYNVYMHDTPTKKLFEKTERTFSSGCIRLSNPFGLAEYLLRDKWDTKKIIKTIASGETRSVNLTNPIDVYIKYFTAWVDDSGRIQFRKDIYKRDNGFLQK